MEKVERLSYFKELQRNLTGYDDYSIEDGLLCYFTNHFKQQPVLHRTTHNESVEDIFTKFDFPLELEYAIEFFEFLLDKNEIERNGIVFTPKYIADYIVHESLKEITTWDNCYSIIDPGCGCGIFLIAAIEYIHTKFSVPITQLIEHNIYGMDIKEDNVRRCKQILSLFSIQNGELPPTHFHIHCCDSLKADWTDQLGLPQCDFIIGNPPYVNPHDLTKETVSFLKENFSTTKSGVFNIYYAFIEKSMQTVSSIGNIGFIVPNNFLTIKSAMQLRTYLQEKQCIRSIVDFCDNMIFKPIRTYNCIIHLETTQHPTFRYAVLENTDDIPASLHKMLFSTMESSQLDKNGWKLVDSVTRQNLLKIEGQHRPIKDFIRTGIATLRDGIYMVEKDASGYYKIFNGVRFPIESGIVTSIYKIPDLKNQTNLSSVKRHIIFPYYKTNGKFTILSESVLKKQYPNTYQYLLTAKSELDLRDKGKINPAGWYAYGRTQGLNKYGKKLLFPTFANTPQFTYVTDESCLFCNGYAVFEDPYIPLDILCKILNSTVMEYYVRQTSYPIEGGYYCYQKKYIERFSIPTFSVDELEFIRKNSKDEVDRFLIQKYQLIT